MQQHIQIPFEEFSDIDSLDSKDALLLVAAKEAIQLSYAPYSKFQVGAAARLQNGIIVKGSNQENASFPAGLCAERVLLSLCSSLYPGMPIVDMAISYQNKMGESNKPISPCGVCRQSLSEYEHIVNQSIRLILGGIQGPVIVIDKASHLLPFAFSGADMK